MQHEIGGMSGATGQIAAVFDADDGALGLVTRAAGGREAVSLALDGVGEVWLDPVLKRAVARVDDWTAFCTAPAARLRTRPSGAPAGVAQRELSELLWTLGYHSSRGRLPASINRHAVIRLAHWPNLSRLPRTPDMYRLCALLARRPSSIHLAGRLVGVDEPQVFQFFSAAHAGGAIEMITRDPSLSQVQAHAQAEEADAARPLSETSVTSMLKQLWNKMTGR